MNLSDKTLTNIWMICGGIALVWAFYVWFGSSAYPNDETGQTWGITMLGSHGYIKVWQGLLAVVLFGIGLAAALMQYFRRQKAKGGSKPQ